MKETAATAIAPSALSVLRKNSGGLTELEQAVADAPVGTPDHWANKSITGTVRNAAPASHAQVVQLEQRKIAGDQSQMDKVSVH